jgi:hypothetical protein
MLEQAPFKTCGSCRHPGHTWDDFVACISPGDVSSCARKCRHARDRDLIGVVQLSQPRRHLA